MLCKRTFQAVQAPYSQHPNIQKIQQAWHVKCQNIHLEKPLLPFVGTCQWSVFVVTEDRLGAVVDLNVRASPTVFRGFNFVKIFQSLIFDNCVPFRIGFAVLSIQRHSLWRQRITKPTTTN